MTAKIPVTKIEILYTEGTPKTPRTFQSWRDVDAFVFSIGESARGRGYRKTGFCVTFADGDTYEGRIDACPGDTNIRKHMRQHCLYYSGRSTPWHKSEEEWGAFLSQVVKPEVRAALGRILDTYDLEGEMVNVAGLARRIPAAADVIVRESILTMGIGDKLATFTFRCPLGGGNSLACEDFAVRLSLAVEEGAADPFARARALRGQAETVD